MLDPLPLLHITAFLDNEVKQTFAFIIGSFVFAGLVTAVVLYKVMRTIHPPVLKTGTRARGVIRSLEQTGTRINGVWRYKLEIQVHPEGEPPFNGHAFMVIPIHQIQNAQPGQTVTVRFNPEKRESDMGIEGFGFAEDGFADEASLMQTLQKQQAEKARLNEIGLAATAIVVGQEDLGPRVNRIGAVVRLKVKVIQPDGTPYDATMITVIHKDRLHRYDVGAEVPIRFDPASPTTVCIDASRAFTSNPGEDPLAGQG